MVMSEVMPQPQPDRPPFVLGDLEDAEQLYHLAMRGVIDEYKGISGSWLPFYIADDMKERGHPEGAPLVVRALARTYESFVRNPDDALKNIDALNAARLLHIRTNRGLEYMIYAYDKAIDKGIFTDLSMGYGIDDSGRIKEVDHMATFCMVEDGLHASFVLATHGFEGTKQELINGYSRFAQLAKQVIASEPALSLFVYESVNDTYSFLTQRFPEIDLYQVTVPALESLAKQYASSDPRVRIAATHAIADLIEYSSQKKYIKMAKRVGDQRVMKGLLFGSSTNGVMVAEEREAMRRIEMHTFEGKINRAVAFMLENSGARRTTRV
jgi:hypothetical protein